MRGVSSHLLLSKSALSASSSQASFRLGPLLSALLFLFLLFLEGGICDHNVRSLKESLILKIVLDFDWQESLIKASSDGLVVCVLLLQESEGRSHHSFFEHSLSFFLEFFLDLSSFPQNLSSFGIVAIVFNGDLESVGPSEFINFIEFFLLLLISEFFLFLDFLLLCDLVLVVRVGIFRAVIALII